MTDLMVLRILEHHEVILYWRRKNVKNCKLTKVLDWTFDDNHLATYKKLTVEP